MSTNRKPGRPLRRCLRRFVRFFLACFVLLLVLIGVEIIAGWRCDLQGEIPAPVPQPSARKSVVAGIKDYARPEDDAYLSLPEWYIVWSYQEKADSQKFNRPSAFPYFGAVRQYWSNYCCISRLTRRKYGFNAGEQVMLVVIGNSFSGEYILKGLYEKTIGRLSEWTAGDYPSTEEDNYAYRVARDYADFVHIRPFYEFQFARRVKGLWSANHLWGAHLLRKWERRVFLTADYTIEAFYCWVIEKGTHLSYGYEPDQTYVWLEKVDDATLQQIPQAKVVKSAGPRAAIVVAPRYQPFTSVALALAQHGGHFVEIAGNSSITISVLAPQSWGGEIRAAGGPVAQRLFSLPLLTRPGWQRVVLRCDVLALDRALNALASDGVMVEHVYDY
jgi:hypothetical protein